MYTRPPSWTSPELQWQFTITLHVIHENKTYSQTEAERQLCDVEIN